MADTKKTHFSKSPILKIFLRKFLRIALGLVGLNDAQQAQYKVQGITILVRSQSFRNDCKIWRSLPQNSTSIIIRPQRPQKAQVRIKIKMSWIIQILPQMLKIPSFFLYIFFWLTWSAFWQWKAFNINKSQLYSIISMILHHWNATFLKSLYYNTIVQKVYIARNCMSAQVKKQVPKRKGKNAILQE